MEDIKLYVNLISKIIEAIGVLTIFTGVVVALVKFLLSFSKHENAYATLRQTLGKSILLGLEILIAADIMATVVDNPSLKDVLILGGIVLIRTFLSLSLQVELEGKFPWQRSKT
ncbi:MAG: hypothetical protein CR989_00525 [Flavobacteriales bacterium]|nr:MAG: hypothetical protein CR989_00525 [Flavobacteriales bacterium]